MRFSEDVPSAREIAANMANMLLVWGFASAHFVGHSFGTFLVSWMLRYQPGHVERCTFVDPVCFMLLKVLVEGHEIQEVRPDNHLNAVEMMLKYFVMTELFVCNFVNRCFFWEESQLELDAIDDMDCLLVLESMDRIVPTHSIRRLALTEQHRRRALRGRCAGRPGEGAQEGAEPAGLDVLWLEDQPHAGFLVDQEANIRVGTRLRAFHMAGESQCFRR